MVIGEPIEMFMGRDRNDPVPCTFHCALSFARYCNIIRGAFANAPGNGVKVDLREPWLVDDAGTTESSVALGTEGLHGLHELSILPREHGA